LLSLKENEPVSKLLLFVNPNRPSIIRGQATASIGCSLGFIK
jgi:hypothetical protein